MRYVIYRLTKPREQVGAPAYLKWAVGLDRGQGVGFLDAFRTKRAARDFIHREGACILCGEVVVAAHPRCLCEREAMTP